MMGIGKERYGFFRKRYYIKVDNITNYYYSKYHFVKTIVENVEKLKIGAMDELKIDSLLEKML